MRTLPCIFFLGTVGIFGESFGYVINNKRFPSNFMFGVSTASYQVEGGWNEDGKSISIWDNITHIRPDYIANRDNGDVACDSYHKYEEDLKILKDLGVSHYRFSLAWTRILPEGMATKINAPGIAYYKNLIKLLKSNNIEPVVTLYHWDLPQILQDRGGFLNESVVTWFTNYARVCFLNFGEDVKYWITFNEAKQVCSGGYGFGHKAPAIKSEGLLEYACAHNLIKAHASAWHLYDKIFRSKQQGKVSLSLDTSWYESASNKSEDIKAAETKMQFEFGWFAHPIFLGDYPEIMKLRIANRSKAEGYTKSRLPEFSDKEVSYIKGTNDYLAINTYTTSMVKAIPEPAITVGKPSRYGDIGVNDYFLDSWKKSTLDWLRVVPFGMRKLMKYMKDNLNDPEVIITENGVSDYGTLEDNDRIFFVQNYVSNLRDAMEKDAVKVFGYTFWSVMDNFEWNDGYRQKFGLYQVDFKSTNRTRTAKKSAVYYKRLCHSRCLVETCVD